MKRKCFILFLSMFCFVNNVFANSNFKRNNNLTLSSYSFKYNLNQISKIPLYKKEDLILSFIISINIKKG